MQFLIDTFWVGFREPEFLPFLASRFHLFAFASTLHTDMSDTFHFP